MKPYDKRQRMIAEILNEFNFKRVHRAMRALDWRWGFDAKTPSIDELRDSARERMESAMDGCLKSDDVTEGIPYMSSSGGLKATAYKDSYGQIDHLELEFILTEWDSDGQEFN